jgi:hypothetical protein
MAVIAFPEHESTKKTRTKRQKYSHAKGATKKEEPLSFSQFASVLQVSSWRLCCENSSPERNSKSFEQKEDQESEGL